MKNYAIMFIILATLLGCVCAAEHRQMSHEQFKAAVAQETADLKKHHPELLTMSVEELKKSIQNNLETLEAIEGSLGIKTRATARKIADLEAAQHDPEHIGALLVLLAANAKEEAVAAQEKDDGMGITIPPAAVESNSQKQTGAAAVAGVSWFFGMQS